VYESASAPRRTLEVTVRRNLTPDQFRTDEMQAEHDLTRGGRLDGLGGPANQAYYGAPVVDGVIHQRTVSFLGATELTLDMAPARSDLDLGVRRPTVIAADRLLGVPVRRR